MAIPAVQSGAFQAEAPPINEPIRLRVWDLEEGRVSLYRVGDELHVKFSGADAEFRHQIGFEGDIDAMAEAFSNSSPLRIGRRIRFISAEMENVQFPSMIDPTVMITHRMWGVTLVCQMPDWMEAIRTREIIDATCSLGGHAYLLLETINSQGHYEAKKAHIYVRPETPIGYATPSLSNNVGMENDWPHSEVILKRAAKIQAIMDYVMFQVEEHRQAVQLGNPWPIRFDDKDPIPEERIHNCLSWDLDALTRGDIRIPHFSSWYIPRWHVREIVKSCKEYVREGLDISHAIPEEAREELQQDRREITKLENELTPFIAIPMACAMIPVAGWITLPVVLPVFGIGGAVLGVRCHIRKKALEKKQVEHLVRFCKGD